MIPEKQLAPDFILQDEAGVERRLSDHRGKWVVLYFYPKDDTPGCTAEACN
ncbi:MAG: redoxin domain-containing protein, partial [Anaerolineaceae bacterium]